MFSHQERTRILYAFKHSPDVNTVFLSKVLNVNACLVEVFSDFTSLRLHRARYV